MFDNHKPRYMTKAISEKLSQDHLHFILHYLVKHQEQLTDYLQVFDFYIENNQQWLIQRQEEPDIETTILVELVVAPPINRTVWVMDQGDHVMILFPIDY